ncbi:MAG: ATP-binding cassette domain-containing protein [Thermomicrobiales bacterium]
MTRGLTKRYGALTALQDLDLTIPLGSIYGFLGPNGAGKTTTIKLLMGFLRASSGSATIFGHETWKDGVAARRDLGFLVQPDNLFPEMTGLAQLDYAAKLSGRPPITRDRLLEALELGRDALSRRLSAYSKGMRQKLALTATMQHNPRLLILDEPTDGLDPLIQRNFDEVLRSLNAGGTKIFMSSHDLAEVERTCELVAVVKGGRLVAEETVEGLKRLQRRRAVVTFASAIPPGLDRLSGMTELEREGARVTLLLDRDVNGLIAALAGHDVADIVIAPPGLDDIFMGFYDQREGGASAVSASNGHVKAGVPR